MKNCKLGIWGGAAFLVLSLMNSQSFAAKTKNEPKYSVSDFSYLDTPMTKEQVDEIKRKRDEEAALAKQQEEFKRQQQIELQQRREQEAALAKQQKIELQQRREQEAALAKQQKIELQRQRAQEAALAKQQKIELQRQRAQEKLGIDTLTTYQASTVQAPQYQPSQPLQVFSAHDEEPTPSSYQSMKTSPTSARNLKGAFGAEISGSLLGGYGSSATSTGFGSTEIMGAIHLKSFLTQQLAMTASGSFFSLVSDNSKLQSVPGFGMDSARDVYPFMLGMRYQEGQFLSNSKLKPWAEAEAGLALIRDPFNQVVYSQTGSANWFTQIAARASIGMDYFLDSSQNFYSGVKVGYLITSGFSNAQMGLSLGYLF